MLRCRLTAIILTTDAPASAALVRKARAQAVPTEVCRVEAGLLGALLHHLRRRMPGQVRDAHSAAPVHRGRAGDPNIPACALWRPFRRGWVVFERRKVAR